MAVDPIFNPLKLWKNKKLLLKMVRSNSLSCVKNKKKKKKVIEFCVVDADIC